MHSDYPRDLLATKRLREPAFTRLWQRSRAVLERNGGIVSGTTVSISEPTDAERAAISSLLGRHRKSAKVLRVELDAVDAVLHTAGIAGGVHAWLETIGGPLRNRPAEAAADREWRDAVWQVALDHPLASEPWFGRWVDALRAEGLLRRLAPGIEDELLADALDVLSHLPSSGVSLAVLAGSVTKDTKRLTDTALATVVQRALVEWAEVDRPRTTVQKRELWQRFGVIMDDLSSHVLVLNLRPKGIDALAQWLDDAASFGEPFRITLRQLMNTDADEFVLTSDRLYVCENPAVLMEAAGQLCEESQPLICTEGQPSAAFWALMKRVKNTDVRVHADFDWAGLRIAGAVIEQCAAVPWRFGTIDYEKAVAQYDGLQLSGSASSSPWDPTLAQALATHERIIYEEQVIDDLLEDLRQGVKHDNNA